MLWGICIVIFAAVVFVFFREKSIIHPVIIFYGLWLCCLVCAGLRLYRMRSFSDKGVIFIAIGLIGFGIGSYLAAQAKHYRLKVVLNGQHRRQPDIQDTLQSYIPKRFRQGNINLHTSKQFSDLFLILAYAGIIILVLYALKALSRGVPYSYIRNMYYGYGDAKKLIPSTFINTFLNWVSVPCLYALIPIAMINIFEKNGRKFFSLLVFVAVALYIFGSAGRFMLMFICVQGFSMLVFYRESISKKAKKMAVAVIAFVVAVLLIITSIRAAGATGKKVNTFYAYLSIPTYLFDYWLRRNGGAELHGSAFFYGILTFLNYFTSKIGFDIPIYREAYEVIQVTQDSWVDVFPGEWYNAYVSMFYYFYIDFGIVGIVLGSALFGYICYMIYYNAFRKENIVALIYYMLIIQCIICSLVRWQLATITMVMAFLVEFFITQKKFKFTEFKFTKFKLTKISVKK